MFPRAPFNSPGAWRRMDLSYFNSYLCVTQVFQATNFQADFHICQFLWINVFN